MTSPRQPRALWASYGALLLVFTFMLFWRISERPMHHDEGVGALFIMEVLKTGFYRYDPANYHGPAFFDLSAAALAAWGFIRSGFSASGIADFSGVTDSSLRLTVAVTGILALLGLVLASVRIGSWGALAALFLFGLSCDFLFYSRDFMLEPLFILCSLGVYLGMALYRDTRKKAYFFLASACASLLFCTKETAIVVLPVMALSCLASEFAHAVLSGNRPRSALERIEKAPGEWLAECEPALRPGLLIAAAIWFLLFSGFFKNLPGLQDSFRAFGLYTRQGTRVHVKSFDYFLSEILTRNELALLALSFVGIVAAFITREKKGLFLAFWTAGIFTAFSLIPYKTPWIVLNMLLPMALVSGYGVETVAQAIARRDSPRHRRASYAALAGGVAALASVQLPLTLRTVYTEYDDDRHPQVYVHTYRDIYRLLNDIEDFARKSGQGVKLKINVVSPEQWPLAFYLRNKPGVLFWGRLEGIGPVDAPLILAGAGQETALKAVLKAPYVARDYRLRPGVALKLFINTDHFPEFSVNPVGASYFLNSRAVYGILQPGLAKTAEGSAGYLDVRAYGTYSFSVESRGACRLLIDDSPFLDSERKRAAKKAVLSEGFHKIDLRRSGASSPAALKLFWTPPGGAETEVPVGVLFHGTAQ